MELGALVCTPRNAQCRICPVQKHCVAFQENRVEALPNLGKRTATTGRRFIAVAVEKNGRFLVRQRPAGVVNAQLWEFPNIEVGAENSEPQPHQKLNASSQFSAILLAKMLRVTDSRCLQIKPLITVKHSITRYRITLEAFHATFGGKRENFQAGKNGFWKTPEQLQMLAFTGAHRKILHALAAKNDG